MNALRLVSSCLFTILTSSCATLKPPITVREGSLEKYKYVIIAPTNSMSSNAGLLISGQYISSSKSVNPADVISGHLAKAGFIRIPEEKPGLAEQTLIVNYGESGRRSTALGGYTIEVTIQMISAATNTQVCLCTAEGQGETEADDIRKAISRCLSALLPINK